MSIVKSCLRFDTGIFRGMSIYMKFHTDTSGSHIDIKSFDQTRKMLLLQYLINLSADHILLLFVL
jgi:hypothetical protein